MPLGWVLIMSAPPLSLVLLLGALTLTVACAGCTGIVIELAAWCIALGLAASSIYDVVTCCLLDDTYQVAWRDIVFDALQDLFINMPSIGSLFVPPVSHVFPSFLLCIPAALNDFTIVELGILLVREGHLGP